MKDAQVTELLLQALETELGGTKVYMTAIKCTTNKDLKQEFTEYLDQTRRHVEIVKALLVEFGLDPKATSPGREVVRRIGRSLVGAMQKALAEGPPEAAQLGRLFSPTARRGSSPAPKAPHHRPVGHGFYGLLRGAPNCRGAAPAGGELLSDPSPAPAPGAKGPRGGRPRRPLCDRRLRASESPTAREIRAEERTRRFSRSQGE